MAVPLMHVQLEAPTLSRVSDSMGHCAHVLSPALAANVPWAQGTHANAPLEPVLGVIVPAAHGWHGPPRCA